MRISKHKTVLAAARQLGVHPTTIYQLVRDGRLSAAKIGRAWHIPVEALNQYLQQIMQK